LWFTSSALPYRPTERTEARRRQTRERIVRAAHDQIAEGGYASAPVQVVAARAGVATGTVYRHFDSKAELFAEVFRRAAQRELDVVAAVTSDRERPFDERGAAGAEAFARRALAAPTLAYALLAEPVDPLVEAERLHFRRGHHAIYAELLAEGIAAGELEPLDIEVVGAALVGAFAEALVGPLSGDFRNRTRHGHEALVASLVQFTLRAIQRRDSHVRQHAHA
jgi:AcrR family transcriptional regulator